MSIAGNLTITVHKLPLLGMCGFVVDMDPVDLEAGTVAVYILPDNSTDLADALITHDQTDLVDGTTVQVELSDEEKALLSECKLYTLIIVAEVALVSYTVSAYLLPVRSILDSTLSMSLQPTLSTSYINRLSITALSGGTSGCLDYITTASKTVGIIVEFILASGEQPQQWVLEAGTSATDAGAIQRPTDYNASTNAKIWRRCM